MTATSDAATSDAATPTTSAVGPAVARAWGRLAAGEGTFERPPVFDVVLTVVLAVPASIAFAGDPRWAAASAFSPTWLGWVLLTAMFASLAWRRVVPLTTMAVTGFATGAYSLLGFSLGPAVAAVLLALYSVTAYGTRADGRNALMISGGFIAASFGVAAMRGVTIEFADIAVNVGAFVSIWALADRTHVRRQIMAQLTARADEAERTRELAAELAVADERRRIARELHDVVAHAVSVVVIQAGAGRRVAATDPTAATEALAAIESTGREALVELRRLVGVLRDDVAAPDAGRPQPTLADLPGLVDRLRDAGVPVELRDLGPRGEIPPGVGLSVYRIVQEALTNALKHAGPVERIRIVLERQPDLLVVSVEDDGRERPETGERPVEGTGIVGMRERAAMLGGTLRAGPGPAGGFLVRARLPLPAVPPVRHRSAGAVPVRKVAP